jgi:hypothetical protein
VEFFVGKVMAFASGLIVAGDGAGVRALILGRWAKVYVAQRLSSGRICMGRQFFVLALIAGSVFSDYASMDAEASVRGKSYSGFIYSAQTATSPLPFFGRLAFPGNAGFRFDLGSFPVGIIDQYYGLALEQDLGIISFVEWGAYDFYGQKVTGAGIQILDVVLGTVTIEIFNEETPITGVIAFTREANPPTHTNKGP